MKCVVLCFRVVFGEGRNRKPHDNSVVTATVEGLDIDAVEVVVVVVVVVEIISDISNVVNEIIFFLLLLL